VCRVPRCEGVLEGAEAGGPSRSRIEMEMGKYLLGITTSYPYTYPRHKKNPTRSHVPTKIKHLSKYYTIQISNISI
jgi:hypothetical protein